MNTEFYKYLTLILVILTFGSIDLIANPVADVKTVEISLPSVQCGMCSRTIKSAIGVIDGVIKSKVDLKNKKVTVKFDDSKTSKEEIENAITSAGYDANDKAADSDAYENLSTCCKKPE